MLNGNGPQSYQTVPKNMIPKWFRELSEVLDPSCLLPGDLLLVRMIRPDWFRRRIVSHQNRYWEYQDSKWTHAAIIKSEYSFVEMTTKGINIGYLWDYQDGKWEIKIRRIPELSPDQRHRIVDAAYQNQLLFNEYDFIGIFKLMQLKTSQDHFKPTGTVVRASICSALYVRAVTRLGIHLGEGIDPRIVTPAQLSASSLLTDIAIRKVSPENFNEWWHNDKPINWPT